GEDRLARARFAGDRVQPRRKLELRLADQDQVLDAQAAQHAPDGTHAVGARLRSFRDLVYEANVLRRGVACDAGWRTSGLRPGVRLTPNGEGIHQGHEANVLRRGVACDAGWRTSGLRPGVRLTPNGEGIHQGHEANVFRFRVMKERSGSVAI